MLDISKINTDRINGLEEILNTLLSPGDICYSLRNEKEGWLLCNGQAVSRTTYQELFATIGTTYGQGDDTTTFNVPDYRGKFLQMVSDSQTVGQEIEAGLPNITGTLSSAYAPAFSINSNGCFTNTQSGSGANGPNNGNGGGNSSAYSIPFDASKSNSIYGNSSTVQPPAFTVNYFIKY